MTPDSPPPAPPDDFFVGYHPGAPDSLARWLRQLTALLLTGVIVLAWAVAGSQDLQPDTVYAYREPVSWEGRIRERPYPMLVTETHAGGVSHIHLSAPGKFGAQDLARNRDGEYVSLRGVRIARGNQTMAELVPGSIVSGSAPPRTDRRIPDVEELGRRTLIGEIVDSKCFLGAMNPGILETHRGCAIRCLNGGILPLLVVRGPGESEWELILVDPDGAPVTSDIFARAGLQVRLTGQVQREDDLFFFKVDPTTYEIAR